MYLFTQRSRIVTVDYTSRVSLRKILLRTAYKALSSSKKLADTLSTVIMFISVDYMFKFSTINFKIKYRA